MSRYVSNMHDQILATIGLSKAEAKVYEALIRLGPSATGELCKQSQVKSSHIYAILDELLRKGLATYHIQKNIKFFEATSPETLKKLYEEKKQQLLAEETKVSQTVAELLTIQRKSEVENQIKVYEGTSGIKSAIEKMLESSHRGDTYYVLGSPLIASKKLHAYFKDIHARRIKKGIAFKIIYNANAREFAKERTGQPLTEVKVLDITTPTEFAIYGETVQIIIFSNNPIVLEVKNKEIADSFLEYFNLMWKQSRPLR